MPSLDTLVVFAVAVLAFAVIPGPSVIYVVTRSVDQGRRAGVVSASAMAAGTLVHVAAATLGLSALLASSAAAFTVVKYGGAAYLIYLGVRTLMKGEEFQTQSATSGDKMSRVFYDGAIVALLNPKTALFFLAFLPQFVDTNRGPDTLQLAVLGSVLVAIAFISDSTYAIVTGSVGDWLRNRINMLRRSRYVTGTAYMALGISVLLTSRSRNT